MEDSTLRSDLALTSGASLVGFTQADAGTNSRTVQDKLRDVVSALDFAGVDPSGTEDSTEGLQLFLDYCRENHRFGSFGPGTFKLSGPLNIPPSQDWGLRGEAYGGTILRQSSNNTPIFLFGAEGPATSSFNILLEDIAFAYVNLQGADSPMGCPIYFQTMWFHVAMHRLVFDGGRYGIKVASGIGAPWGCVWDDLTFGGTITGGAMDWSGAVNSVPNNKWGRLVVSANTMEGPLFNGIKGYNWVIGTLELLSANLGPQLMTLQAGSRLSIGAVKLENGAYAAAQNLFTFATNSFVHIGQVSLGGSNLVLTPASGSINVFNVGSGGTTGSYDVDQIVVQAKTLSGSVFLINGNGGSMRIGHVTTDANNWLLSNTGSSTTSETLTVDDWNSGHLSQLLPDADYAIGLTGPTVLDFGVEFTAQRTITLPSSLNNMFNGMRRTLRFRGAINGVNSAKVVSNGVVLSTISTDGVIVEYTWRRSVPVQSGWVITGYSVLPS